jgi:hypothetical protein
MDIKRVNPGAPAQPADGAKEVKQSTRFESAASAASGKSEAAARPEGLLGEPCRRADLTSSRWNEILQASVDKLMERHAAANGPLPDGMREKIAGMLAADPYFAKRVFHLLDQEAAQAEGR